MCNIRCEHTKEFDFPGSSGPIVQFGIVSWRNPFASESQAKISYSALTFNIAPCNCNNRCVTSRIQHAVIDAELQSTNKGLRTPAGKCRIPQSFLRHFDFFTGSVTSFNYPKQWFVFQLWWMNHACTEIFQNENLAPERDRKECNAHSACSPQLSQK